MDGVYFPVTIHEFAADITFRDLNEGEFEIGGLPVRTMLLNHPGNCLGYRIDYGGRSICYVADNELYDADSPQRSEEYMEHLIDFTRGTDALVTDCTYTDEIYPRKMGWGHSSVSQVAELAWRAQVKNLYLIHHDPDDNDDVIDAKLARAQERLAKWGAFTRVVAPSERTAIEI
jgi:phosphoribosyl 1,2-cyclic phosphodiesterase